MTHLTVVLGKWVGNHSLGREVTTYSRDRSGNGYLCGRTYAIEVGCCSSDTGQETCSDGLYTHNNNNVDLPGCSFRLLQYANNHRCYEGGSVIQ